MRTRAMLGIVLPVLCVALAACGSSGDDATADAEAHCAAELANLRVADVDNVVGCGEEVILREGTMNRAFPEFEWSEDSGEVNEPKVSVEVIGPQGCSSRKELDVVGAQVVELHGFGDAYSEESAWQDVLVMESPADAQQVFESQVTLATCEDELLPVSPDGNFFEDLGSPVRVERKGDNRAIVSDETQVVALVNTGRYYSQIWIDSSWLEDGRADQVIALVEERMQKG